MKDIFTTKNIIAIVIVGTALYFIKKNMVQSTSKVNAKQDCIKEINLQKSMRTPEQRQKAINDCIQNKSIYKKHPDFIRDENLPTPMPSVKSGGGSREDCERFINSIQTIAIMSPEDKEKQVQMCMKKSLI